MIPVRAKIRWIFTCDLDTGTPGSVIPRTGGDQKRSAMWWMMGIQSTTTGATIRSSTSELHPPLQLKSKHYKEKRALEMPRKATPRREAGKSNGVDDGDRTHDHRSHNPELY